MEPEVKKEDGRYAISMEQIMAAYRKVRSNKGSGGIDGMTWEEFDRQQESLLYKLWNRMTSGSYFPQATREVIIPRPGGGERRLGIPLLLDRIAQQVVVDIIEPIVEQEFHPDSYGYRPGKSAHDALRQCRQNCFRYGWVIDLDIKGFFDNIDHELLMKAVERFTTEKWILLYVKRWLNTATHKAEGHAEQRTKGTPQGGVISPVLANMFLHFVFDKWMQLYYANNLFERYADDVIVHCKSLQEAEQLSEAISKRMEVCGLTLHPEKTKIVKCQRRGSDDEHANKSFDFLGYRFKPRKAKTKEGVIIGTFTPGISSKAVKKIQAWLRESKVFKNTSQTLMELSERIKLQSRGWINYYGKFRPTELRKVFNPINKQIGRWYAKKHKCGYIEANACVQKIAAHHSYLFVHWYCGHTSF
ncbi:MAG TPA: group II intron reverse transcriptase/maturase [Chitinophagaceae bacterium]